MVRTNVQACLRGAAMNWYTVELSDLEKQSSCVPILSKRVGFTL